MAKMRHGVNPLLEAEADAILKQATVGQKAADKTDILTPWKADNRRGFEIYPNTGVADPAIRSGIFGRAANTSSPHLNSIDGAAPALGRGTVHSVGYDRTFSLAEFIERELSE